VKIGRIRMKRRRRRKKRRGVGNIATLTVVGCCISFFLLWLWK
jgi:hypothetical protein